MALDSPKLQKILEDVKIGAIQLPDFQREWKWDDQRIRELIATVTLDYPLGVVMTLETGGRSPFRTRPLTGAEASGSVTPDLLLLDGQQRLTSLFQALHLDRPVRTVDARGKELKRWYYVDIAKAVRHAPDRDEAIVSVPEDRVLRADFARRVELDLSSAELECRAAHFPLSRVFDSDSVTAWQRRFVKMDEERNWDLWAKFEQQVLNHIRSFQIPMIRLSAATTRDAVCSVFERVNTGGVPLNVFELLTATYAGDQEYERREGHYYRLPEVWQDIKKGLVASYPVFGRVEQGSGNGLSSSDFLQAVTLVYTWEAKQSKSAAAVSCKRRDLLALPLADFHRLAPRLASAFEWVGEFLQRQYVVRVADLPYQTQLVPLAAVRAVLGERTDPPDLLALIERWYWCGVLGEMYSGSTESRFTRDLEQLVAAASGSRTIPDTIAEAVFVSDRLGNLTTRNSAAYKGIYALILKQQAVDWYYNEAPFTPGTLLQHSVDIHQIFPKVWFTRNTANDRRGYSIVNKTPLSYRASRSLTGSPAHYLSVLAQEAGIRPEWFDDVIATHLIDPATLRRDDFDRFYVDRARQLLELVEAAMGKRAVHRDQTGW